MHFLRERIAYYLLLALPGLVIFYHVLFGGHIFADGDAVLQLYPALDFFRGALRNGDSFIWNPHVMTGFVMAAGLMGGFFSKLNQIVYLILPVPIAYAWLTFLSFWLASVFTFEFLNKIGLGKPAGIFAAFVFPWISANFLWAGNMTVTSGLFLFPLILYVFLLFDEKRVLPKNFFLSLGVGVGVGTVLIAYHFQWTFQMMLIAALWAILLDWRARRFRVIGWAALTFGIASFVVFPQYEWLLRLLPLSAREGGLSFGEVNSGMIKPGDFLSLIFPTLSVPRVLTSTGFFYLGAVPLFMFIISWFGKKDFYYRFFALLFVVSLMISLQFSPLAVLLHQLPIFSSFRALPRILHFGFFGAVVMAAYGLDTVVRKEKMIKIQKLPLWFWRISLSILALFLVGSAVFHLYGESLKKQFIHYFETNYQESDLTLPREHYYQVIDRIFLEVQSGATFPHLPITVSIISFVLAAALLRYHDRIDQKKLIVGLVGVAALNLGLINFFVLQTRTVPAQELWEPPLVVRYLRSQDQEFRVLTLFPGSASYNLLDVPYGYEARENVALMKNMLIPNLNLLYKIDGFDYYDNLMDRRHARLLAYVGSDRAQVGERLTETDIPFDQKIRAVLERLPVLSAYNVRYLMSAYPLEHKDLGLVFEWKATRYEIPLYLYENQNVRSRYYVTSEVIFSGEPSEEVLWSNTIVSLEEGKTLIECERCPQVITGKGEWRLLKQQNAEYTFEVNTQSPQFFVFGQNFLPGWKASLDGKDTTIYRANYVNQAVFIPSGTHEIVFEYK